ncbi:hypothetical protein L6452_21961 [Arctium lappa]|uniref:Uncharacterized protein n=1 Tax=Arctium lappa TaxID=4217 RepID=A0ACB9AZ82_ARCLA|nr:hypothetical protein L6452_21961 [Arctium lappa]
MLPSDTKATLSHDPLTDSHFPTSLHNSLPRPYYFPQAPLKISIVRVTQMGNGCENEDAPSRVQSPSSPPYSSFHQVWSLGIPQSCLMVIVSSLLMFVDCTRRIVLSWYGATAFIYLLTGFYEAITIPQTECFLGGRGHTICSVRRTIPAPELTHAIAAAIHGALH